MNLTEKELELVKYSLNYLKSNLSDEAFCLGGIDDATEEELIQAEKNIETILEKIK